MVILTIPTLVEQTQKQRSRRKQERRKTILRSPDRCGLCFDGKNVEFAETNTFGTSSQIADISVLLLGVARILQVNGGLCVSLVMTSRQDRA